MNLDAMGLFSNTACMLAVGTACVVSYQTPATTLHYQDNSSHALNLSDVIFSASVESVLAFIL